MSRCIDVYRGSG
ncbi:hypothetical protein SS209_00003 [Salmonella enterica subsp. enterica serovar Senftenberg str. SS209]|nr:hypothetical protein SS209_00003 [Salmonella enterica subsp. enterica serovar Senftenberg str. SS209]